MFDFGIGFWILFFFIFVGCGKMCGWGARKYRERSHELESGDGQKDDRLAKLESRLSGRRSGEELPRPTMHRGEQKTPEPARSRRQGSSPLEELQRKFIDGRLSLSEYEQELDRLERLE